MQPRMTWRQNLMNTLFYDSLFRGLAIETVLEVGSGNGKMIDYFQSRGKKTKGIDLHPARPDIQKIDIFNNTFPSESFDLVYTAHVIEHLKEPDVFASELIRLSKRYVCVIAPLPGKKFWDQPDHIRPYTQEALKRIFHLDKWIRAFEINLPGFEPIACVLFDKKESRLITGIGHSSSSHG